MLFIFKKKTIPSCNIKIINPFLKGLEPSLLLLLLYTIDIATSQQLLHCHCCATRDKVVWQDVRGDCCVAICERRSRVARCERGSHKQLTYFTYNNLNLISKYE